MTQEMIDSLVINAIDFLNKSINELQTSPKYSVINFYASIELFLKARLMAEHWSLVFEEPQKANLSKFRVGDFKSVGIDNAKYRLTNIVGVKVGDKAYKCFNDIREHRNRLIHFFHPEYEKPENTTLHEVVAEQCKGWLYLYRLLTIEWKATFAEHLDAIEALDKLMHKHRQFLNAKYEELKPDIDKGRERGVEFIYCYSCGFEASRLKEIHNPLVETNCLICGNEEKQIRVSCPTCGEWIHVYDLGQGTCGGCETEIGIDYLFDRLGVKQISKESLYEPVHAYCSNCEYYDQPSVVPIDDYMWLCLACLTLHDQVDQCEWCAELVTGDVADTYFSGCVMCDGRAGWTKD